MIRRIKDKKSIYKREREREQSDTDIPVVPTCVVTSWSHVCQLWIHA